jgi:hypothetical protein
MVTLKSQTHGHAFGGQTDPADALPAFKHGKVPKPIERSSVIFLRAPDEC